MAPTDVGRASAAWAVGAHAVVWAHTVLGASAFVAALAVCVCLHYRRVVKNHVAAWPDEFWPSVSATVGDWFPERNVFQILIAATSGPRFLLVGLCALAAALQHRPRRAAALLVVGAARTLACGGWVYITSTDHALVHDVAMGLYLGLTPVWMVLCAASLAPGPQSPHAAAHRTAQRVRAVAAAAFYACTPCMVYLYLQHRRHRVPGAYSRYALFEWGLVVFDLAYDAASAWDVRRFTIRVEYADTQPVATPAEARAHSEAVREPSLLFWVATQVYLAFTAWSCVTCLLSLIFYFSVSNMGAEGHELLVLAPVAGLLVANVPPVRGWVAARRDPPAHGRHIRYEQPRDGREHQQLVALGAHVRHAKVEDERQQARHARPRREREVHLRRDPEEQRRLAHRLAVRARLGGRRDGLRVRVLDADGEAAHVPRARRVVRQVKHHEAPLEQRIARVRAGHAVPAVLQVQVHHARRARVERGRGHRAHALRGAVRRGVRRLRPGRERRGAQHHPHGCEAEVQPHRDVVHERMVRRRDVHPPAARQRACGADDEQRCGAPRAVLQRRRERTQAHKQEPRPGRGRDQNLEYVALREPVADRRADRRPELVRPRGDMVLDHPAVV